MSLQSFRRRGTESANNSTAEIEDMTPESIWQSVNALRTELNYMRLENDLIERYLEQNDPLLLLGVTGRRTDRRIQPTRIQFAPQSQEAHPAVMGHEEMQSFRSGDTHSAIMRSRTNTSSFAASVRTIDSITKIRVNYGMRIELCEKDCAKHAAEMEAIRSATREKLRSTLAMIEECRLTNKEAVDTLGEFHEFVMRENKSGMVPLERFLMFNDKLTRNGGAMVEKMRLRTHTMKLQIAENQKALNIKAELSGILRPIDFEQMKTEQEQYQRQVDLTLKHFIGMKRTAADLGLMLAVQRKELLMAGKDLERINSKIARSNAECHRLDAMSEKITTEICDWQRRIVGLQKRASKRRVPSTSDYMDRKRLLSALTHERRMLERERCMAQMKLKSIVMKVSRQKVARTQIKKQQERAARAFETTKRDASV